MSHFKSLSDEKLVAITLQKQGDAAAAFAQLFNRYQKKVSAYLSYQTQLDHSHIQDILQDAFLTAWNKIEQLHDPEKFFQWIVTISRNAMIDHVRGLKRTTLLIEALSEQPQHDTTKIVATSANKLLAKLAEDERDIIALKAVFEFSFDEIAEQLNISTSAAKMRYYRAIEKLQEFIE